MNNNSSRGSVEQRRRAGVGRCALVRMVQFNKESYCQPGAGRIDAERSQALFGRAERHEDTRCRFDAELLPVQYHSPSFTLMASGNENEGRSVGHARCTECLEYNNGQKKR